MKYGTLKTILAMMLGLVALQSTAGAQCRPDRLDGGPCCTAAQPDIPRPRAFRQDSLQICWKDCGVESISNCFVQWTLGTTSFSPCAIRRMDVRMIDAAGTVKWKGRMSVQYSRTWEESDATGVQRQVWRYLANGDLRPTSAAGSSPCPVPPCVTAFGGRIRFTGYVDMARSCSTAAGTVGTDSFAWMLTHACDVIDHAPGFPRAGVFHPDRAYTFVGPAAGFAVSPFQPVAMGSTPQNRVRRVDLSAGAPVCQFEEQIDAGLNVLQQLCICGPTAGLAQYAISDLGLGSSCGTSIFTPGGPFLPGYISMGIGSWTDPTTYPGVEALRWSSGGYEYFDPCVGIVRHEVFFGVTTLGGDFATSIPSSGVPGVPLPRNFVDQCNALRPSGTVMNVPWKKSDHFINLNF